MFMVVCDGKVRTYTDDQKALAKADARDYSSEIEEYRNLPNRLFERIR